MRDYVPGRRLFTVLTTLGALVCATLARANWHDHWAIVWSYDDIRSALTAGGRPGLENMPLGRICQRDSPHVVIENIFGPEARAAAVSIFGSKERLKSVRLIEIAAALADWLQATHREETSRIWKSAESLRTEIARGFFELNRVHTLLGRLDNGASAAYQQFETIRSDLLLEISEGRGSPKMIQALVESYARRVPIENRARISLSLPVSLMRDRPEIAPLLKSLFRAQGTECDIFMSISRRHVGPEVRTDQYEAQLAALKSAARMPGVDGVDITGSLNARGAGEERVDDFARRVLEIAEGKQLRIHAFETAARDPVLEQIVANLPNHRLKAVRFGHIRQIPAPILSRIQQIRAQCADAGSVPRDAWYFEANIVSNIKLHESAPLDEGNWEFGWDQARHTIQMLQGQGFRVVLGSDGHGVLGPESGVAKTIESLARSNPPLSVEELRRLIVDMTEPLAGETPPPSVPRVPSSSDSGFFDLSPNSGNGMPLTPGLQARARLFARAGLIGDCANTGLRARRDSGRLPSFQRGDSGRIEQPGPRPPSGRLPKVTKPKTGRYELRNSSGENPALPGAPPSSE